MAAYTATGAEKENICTIIFNGKAHEEFFWTYLQECRYQDVYHLALVYCLGIDPSTRANIRKIYDFKSGSIKTKCLDDEWQTGASVKTVRLAFNLYSSGTPSVFDYENAEEQLRECRLYSVDKLFCGCYARYFWEAIKIRYPEYCF